jgi:hypothetical protein
MKNIHIIPTDKPSRLFLNKVNNKLLLDSDTYCDLIKRLPSSNYQNIYITNDEEIKESGYVFWEGKIYTYREFMKMRTPVYTDYFSIILTTDQDLIANGVQPIDNEFLEWFVKNPSCEFVEVKKHIGLADYSKSIDNYKYKIIIPQEESKQETLEEAADNWVRQPIIGTKRESFIAGYKLAQERRYSKEEVFSIIDKAFHMYASSHRHDAKEWFEQFKKK